MDFIKKLFKNYWILSLFCIVLGIALIADPGFFTKAIGYAIGGLIAAYGVVELIKYFAKGGENREYSFCLVRGILLCAIGAFIVIKPDFIPKVIAIFCGFYMLISGIVNIQDSLNLRRANVDNWAVSCIPAVITTVVGIILLFDPMIGADAAMIVMGAALLISGITNIFGCFTATRKLKKVSKLIKSGRKSDNDDYIDI